METYQTRVLFALILACTAFARAAQDPAPAPAKITGRVVEQETGGPVVGANVLVIGTMRGAATDENGRFTIDGVTPSSYDILVSAIGYKKEERNITLRPGEEIDLRFSMEETVILMDGLTVTASRYQQSVNDVPVSLSLVPAKEISERNITSVDQALRYVPGVNAMEGGQISVRGSSGFNYGLGSRVLVLLNGNPMMTGDNWDVKWYSIPTYNIKQIEVMKGSGSALYGSSAMGGVINIITEAPEEGLNIHVRSYTGFYNKPSHPEWRWTDRQNHFEGTAVNLSTQIGPFSTLLSSSIENNTGYRENDDQQTFSFMGSLGYHFSNNIRFDLLSGYASKKGGFFIYWKDLNHPYGNGSDPYGYRTRVAGTSTYVYPSISIVLNDRIFVSLKGRYLMTTSEDHLEGLTDESPEREDTFRSSDAQSKGGEAQINLQINPHGVMVIGADFQRDDVESIQYGSRNTARAAYYVQFEQRLWEKLKITLGTRFDGENGDDIESNGELSRKLGLNLTVSKGTNARFSYAEGFRTPAIGERFVSTFTGGLRVSPNPGLRPEKSISTEIGVRQALSRSMNVDFAAFYTKYDDLIEPQLDMEANQAVVIRFQNVVKARIMGFDLSHRTDWWSRLASTRVGYTYIDTEDHSPGDEYGEPLKYRPKHTLYISNDLNLLPLTLGIDLRYLSRIERVDEYHKTYIKDIDKRIHTAIVSLRLGLVKSHFSLRLLIDNLFQYNYITSPANLGPPRTAVLQLNINT